MLDIGSIAPNFSMRVPLATCQCDRAARRTAIRRDRRERCRHGIPTDKRRNHDAPTWWSSFERCIRSPTESFHAFSVSFLSRHRRLERTKMRRRQV
jgi:hypothetical protein